MRIKHEYIFNNRKIILFNFNIVGRNNMNNIEYIDYMLYNKIRFYDWWNEFYEKKLREFTFGIRHIWIIWSIAQHYNKKSIHYTHLESIKINFWKLLNLNVDLTWLPAVIYDIEVISLVGAYGDLNIF